MCFHNRLAADCSLCVHHQGVPGPDPPKKRHCRSLSIPGDAITSPGHHKHWQPQASSIWKPVAVRSHIGSAKMLKSRNSPLASRSRHSSATGSSSPATQGCGGAADLNSSFNRGVSNQSPGIGVWSLASSDSFSTPPESPIPRPASASSGFYDGGSQGSLNSPWLDRDSQPLLCHGAGHRFEFKLRSLSMEEPLGSSSQPTPTVSRTDMAGSMPVIPSHTHSTPSSPRRPRVQRCRSQPCDLQMRKCRLKRRHDDERPTLDFLKMKEVRA